MLPAWLSTLGLAAGALQKQQQDKQRLQMIQALLAQRTQQHPGGLGSQPPNQMGPQNWGANNTSQGGTISDQWGNPIGPAAPTNPAASSAATAPSPVPLPTPNPLSSAQGATPASAPTPSAWNNPTGAQASPVPYLNSPFGPGAGPYAPSDIEDPMTALFASVAFGAI